MMTVSTRLMQTLGPRDRKADCVLVALKFITMAEYTDLEDLVIRELGYRPYVKCGIQTEKFLREERKLFGTTFKRILHIPMRVEQFLKQYPKGTFIVRRKGHAYAIRDGIIFDPCGEQYNDVLTAAWIALK